MENKMFCFQCQETAKGTGCTDNWADGYKGQHGATFPRRSGICFEAQHFPDSPNHPYFPSVVLNPGEQYKQKTIYKFGTIA